MSIWFPSGAKWSPFMLPFGHEMCWVSADTIRFSIKSHMITVFLRNHCSALLDLQQTFKCDRISSCCPLPLFLLLQSAVCLAARWYMMWRRPLAQVDWDDPSQRPGLAQKKETNCMSSFLHNVTQFLAVVSVFVLQDLFSEQSYITFSWLRQERNLFLNSLSRTSSICLKVRWPIVQ